MSLRTSTCDFQDLWGKLKSDVQLIITEPVPADPAARPKNEWTSLYNYVYRLCTSPCTNLPTDEVPPSYMQERNGQPYLLYGCMKSLLKNHIQQRVLPSVRGYDEELLSLYAVHWQNYSVGINAVHSFFYYMNKECNQGKGSAGRTLAEFYTIRDLGLMCWRDNLYLKVNRKLIEAVLQQITRDRDGELINHGLIRDILTSVVQLGLDLKRQTAFYEEQFEVPFLHETERYYSAEVDRVLRGSTLSQYMIRVEKRLEEELRRVVHCMSRTTMEPLLKTLVKIMVERKLDVLLSECTQWFDMDQVEEQKRLYRLLSRTENGLEPLRKIVEDRIDAEGRREIEKTKAETLKDPAVFVDTLLQVHSKYEEMVRNIFQNDEQFVSALEKGCKRFINRNAISTTSGARSAELLAKHCHQILKPSSKMSKSLTDQELDARISRLMVLFRLLEDQDVFHRFYSTMLSRRLIMNQYSSDMEEAMISRLKEVCGYENTYKLQRMFSDINVSADVNQRFGVYLHDDAKLDLGYEFSATVLTWGSWPLSLPKTTFPIPSELMAGYTAFEEFYRSKHNGRKLGWIQPQSTGALKTCYALPNKKTYELQVSIFQMGILLAYNHHPTVDKLSAQALKDFTQLPEKDMLFALQILQRNKVLLCEPAEVGTNFLPEQEFALNYEFKSASRKVPLLAAAPKDSSEDQAMISINTDRKYAIQAAIVRVMKARKTLPHQQLISEVISQLQRNFKPTVQDIKKNIDNLIEKEYMERDEQATNTYNYVA